MITSDKSTKKQLLHSQILTRSGSQRCPYLRCPYLVVREVLTPSIWSYLVCAFAFRAFAFIFAFMPYSIPRIPCIKDLCHLFQDTYHIVSLHVLSHEPVENESTLGPPQAIDSRCTIVGEWGVLELYARRYCISKYKLRNHIIINLLSNYCVCTSTPVRTKRTATVESATS
jgi:hypothetical protein